MWARRLFQGLVILLAATLIADQMWPPDFRRLAASVAVTARDGQVLHMRLSPDGTWRLPTRVEEVDPLYLQALLAYEDRRFYLHPGVDPLAVVRALGQWAVQGRIVSGASTLSMQAARLLAPRRARTLGAKITESLRALQMEARLGKRRILEIYLTLAPFGGNLEGVRAASWAWFGKEPRQLTPAQVALLVVLPQSPNRLRPDRHPQAARRARNKVLQRMAEQGVLTHKRAEEEKTARLPRHRRPMPALAPHLARRLIREARRAAQDGSAEDVSKPAVLRTPLDARLQRDLEAWARRVSLDRKANLAAIIVETRDRAVRAYLGSRDWLEPGRGGAIDLTRAVRSPGSTLKPFIYGLAFEEGLLHPKTLMRDIPTRFRDYAPSNFRHAHYGDVTAAQALQQSLNVPAVAVLDRVGPARLVARLARAGVALRGGGTGLPIALGGTGLTLQGLVTLYADLADSGRHVGLRLLERGPEAVGVAADERLLAPRAAEWVTGILLRMPPPAGRISAMTTGAIGGRYIAYKTGTSYGFRDAWAIGYDGRHTAGMWVGRPDGAASPERIGRNTAAPLLFQLFDHLPAAPAPRHQDAGPPPPAQIRWHGGTDAAAARADGPRITFPPDGSTLPWDEAAGGFRVEVTGGRRPLFWLVNHQPLAVPAYRRWADVVPDGPGAMQLTVLDADGKAGHSELWLE